MLMVSLIANPFRILSDTNEYLTEETMQLLIDPEDTLLSINRRKITYQLKLAL